MKKSLLCLIVLLLGATVAEVEEPAPAYFVRIWGNAVFLENVSVNGTTVVRKTAYSSLTEYVRVTYYLKEGANSLEIDYTSEPQGRLTIAIEKQRIGYPSEEVAKFSRPAEEPPGQKIHKVLSFTLGQKPSAEPAAPAAAEAETTRPRKVWTEEDLAGLRRKKGISTVGSAGVASGRGQAGPSVTLAEDDKQTIRTLIQAAHEALTSKDKAAWDRLYARAFQEESQSSPEQIRMFRGATDEMLPKLFASPQFGVKPLQLEGLEFSVEGDKVVVTRADGLSVLETEQIQWQVDPKTKARMRFNAEKLVFKKYGGQWHHTLPF